MELSEEKRVKAETILNSLHQILIRPALANPSPSEEKCSGRDPRIQCDSHRATSRKIQHTRTCPYQNKYKPYATGKQLALEVVREEALIREVTRVTRTMNLGNRSEPLFSAGLDEDDEGGHEEVRSISDPLLAWRDDTTVLTLPA